MSSQGARSTSGRVQALAVTLQDTNQNLRAVERMLRDLSNERNSANNGDPEFNAPPGIGGTKKYRPPVGDFFLTLKRGFTADQPQYQPQYRPQDQPQLHASPQEPHSGSTTVSTAGSASENQVSKDPTVRRARSSTGWLGGRVLGVAPDSLNDQQNLEESLGNFASQKFEGRGRAAMSDREDYTDFRRGEGDRSRSNRYHDDTKRFYDDSRQDLHTFHQSLRDLSTEQRLLAEELKRGRESAALRAENLNKNEENRNKNDVEVVERVDRRLRQIDDELRAERNRWDRQQEGMIKISLELKEALERQQRKENEARKEETVHKRHEESLAEREGLKKALADQAEQIKEYMKNVLQQKESEKELKELRMQVSEMEGGRRVGRGEEEMEAWRRQISASNMQNEAMKTQIEEVWKVKNEKLKQELEWCKERLTDMERQRDDVRRDLDTQRSRSAALQQQQDRLLSEFNNVMTARIELDEKLTARDFRLNEITLAKDALEREVVNMKEVVGNLERELQQVKNGERAVKEDWQREAARMRLSESSGRVEFDVEMQRLRAEMKEISERLAGSLEEKRDLGVRNRELEKEIGEGRRELEHLRHQNQENEDLRMREHDDLVQKYKIEQARVLGEIEEIKMALEEERSINMLQKKQDASLREELGHLQNELERTRKDYDTVEQRYRELRKELATSAMQAEDGWSKNKEVELELIDARDALVRVARNHCNDLHTIDADVDLLVRFLSPDGSDDGSVINRAEGDKNQFVAIRNKLNRLREILESKMLQRERNNKGGHLEKLSADMEDQKESSNQRRDNIFTNNQDEYDVRYDKNSDKSRRRETGTNFDKYLQPEKESEGEFSSSEIPSPTNRSRSVSPSTKHKRGIGREGTGNKTADTEEEINARYERLKQTMLALRQDLVNAKIFSFLPEKEENNKNWNKNSEKQ